MGSVEQVFISSTREDLREFRAAVRDAVLACRLYPNMMEYWAAMDSTAVEKCLNEIDSSKIYIGIFAHRYGFCPQDSDISITEMEFNHATKLGIPRLCFVIGDDCAWKSEYIEDEPGKTKLRKFKDQIETSLIRAQFCIPKELELEVYKAISSLETYSPRSLKLNTLSVADVSQGVEITAITKSQSNLRSKIYLMLTEKRESFQPTQLVQELADLLGIDSKEISIIHVISGSTIVSLEMPTASAIQLAESADRNNFQNSSNNDVLTINVPDDITLEQIGASSILRQIVPSKRMDLDVFMIAPFRSEFESVFSVIKEVVDKQGLSIKRGDDLFTSVGMVNDIWNAIMSAKIIIADCTGHNANVFYELGIAHTLGKPVILITQDMNDIPFDLRHLRVIVYENTYASRKILEQDLHTAISVLGQA